MKATQNYEFSFFSIFGSTFLFEGSLISEKFKQIWLDELVNLFAIKFSVNSSGNNNLILTFLVWVIVIKLEVCLEFFFQSEVFGCHYILPLQ